MTLKTKSQANTNCSKSKKGEDQLVLSKVWHVSGRYSRQKTVLTDSIKLLYR